MYIFEYFNYKHPDRNSDKCDIAFDDVLYVMIIISCCNIHIATAEAGANTYNHQ